MLKFLSKKLPGQQYPYLLIHFIYFLASFTFTYVYYHKFITPVDLYKNDYGGIFKVLNFEAISTIQFRFLVPLLVGALSAPFDLPPKAVLYLLTMAFTYFTIVVYKKILCLYFENILFNSLLALLIIYPLSWNLIAVNNTFFFSDISSLFFMVLSLYLVLTKKYNLLLPAFFLGVVNHYSIGFIIPAFLLFNYKHLFRARTLSYGSAMVILFAGYYITVKIMLPDLPAERDDGYFVASFSRTLWLIKVMPKHILLRDIFFNFGAIHIFAFLFYFSPVWKKIKREYSIIYLTILIFVLLTITGFGLYSEELRCYVPILPFLMVPAMLYFSQFSSDLLPVKKAMLVEEPGTK